MWCGGVWMWLVVRRTSSTQCACVIVVSGRGMAMRAWRGWAAPTGRPSPSLRAHWVATARTTLADRSRPLPTTWQPHGEWQTDRHDTMRDAILTCNQRLTWVSLIYRTVPTTKQWKTEKLKSKKWMCWQVSVNSPGNPCSQSWRRKGRPRWESVAEKGRFQAWSERVKGDTHTHTRQSCHASSCRLTDGDSDRHTSSTVSSAWSVSE